MREPSSRSSYCHPSLLNLYPGENLPFFARLHGMAGAGKLGCLLPQQVSLREVVDAFSGIDLSSIGLQRVSLEHAYLEVIHTRPAEAVGRDDLRLAA